MIRPSRVRHIFRPEAIPAATLALMLGLLVFNILRHEPFIDYDLVAHTRYAQTLGTGRLPTPADSREFFSPPLAYLPAALLSRMGCLEPATLRGWQSVQIVYAFVLMLGLRRLMQKCHLRPLAQMATLLGLGAAAAFWRSFALIRPEALLCALIVVGILLSLQLVDRKATIAQAILTGAIWGLVALTRQWGVLALISVATWALLMVALRRIEWKTALVTAATVVTIAAPFYLTLIARYGSVTAFNREAKPTELSWSFHPLRAARMPFREELATRPLDILYADTFGDYWMYWLVEGQRKNGLYVDGLQLSQGIQAGQYAHNAVAIRPYVSLVLKASLPLTILMLSAIPFAIARGRRSAASGNVAGAASLLVLLMILGTVIGYAWFVTRYSTTADTDTTKATYLIQMWPLLAILFGMMVDWIAGKSRAVAWVIVGIAVATVAINSGTFVSRYPAPIFSTTWH